MFNLFLFNYLVGLTVVFFVVLEEYQKLHQENYPGLYFCGWSGWDFVLAFLAILFVLPHFWIFWLPVRAKNSVQ